MKHRKQKPNNSCGQMPAIAPSKGIAFSLVSSADYVDHIVDIEPEEVNDSAVDIALSKNCEFVDLEEEIAVDSAKGRVPSSACNQPSHRADHKTSDEKLVEVAAVAADVSSQIVDVCDSCEGEDDNELETNLAHISLLNTPEFVIGRSSRCSTPASLIDLSSDVGFTTDMISLLNCDLSEEDENVVPDDADLFSQSKLKNLTDECRDIAAVESPGAEIPSALVKKDMKRQQSEKKRARKAVDKEHVCTHSYTDAEDPVDEDGLVNLWSDEEMHSVDSRRVKVTPELVSGNPIFSTTCQPSQPLCTQQSLDVGNVAGSLMEERSVEFYSFPLQQLSSYDAECIQLTPQENDSERQKSEDDSMVCTRVASSRKKEKSLLWKKKPRKQRKIVTGESKVSLLKSANIMDEPMSQDSTCYDFAVRQSTAECNHSLQHTSIESGLYAEAVELPELNDTTLTVHSENHCQLQNLSDR